MTPETLTRCALDPALWLLPARMDTREARVMLVAIAYQESGLTYRQQVHGPARSYWQFEVTGVRGVLHHRSTKSRAAAVLEALNYPASPQLVHDAIADNDVLACALARLLLWTLPTPLAANEADGWEQYIEAWRPGKPRPEHWPENYRKAVAACLIAGES